MSAKIEHIKTKGFKGFDIDEHVPLKALYVGENRSGKSTRVAAMMLLTLGFIPSGPKPSKTNADILNDFGIGDDMAVSAKLDGIDFERRFVRGKTGNVSQKLKVNGVAASAKDFDTHLGSVGAPKIINLSDFLTATDQGKVDILFAAYPPKEDPGKIDADIAKKKDAISIIKKDIAAKESTVTTLTKKKTDTERPSGTLSQIKADIETLISQVKDAQDRKKKLEIAEAEERAKASAKQEIELKDEERRQQQQKLSFSYESESSTEPMHYNQVEARLGGLKPTSHNPADSIKKIIDVMVKADCGICAAMIVAKQELKKYC